MSNPPETPLLSAIQQATQRCALIRSSYITSGRFAIGSLEELKELEEQVEKMWPLRRAEIVRKLHPEGEVKLAKLSHVYRKENTVRHGNKPLSEEIAWINDKEHQHV